MLTFLFATILTMMGLILAFTAYLSLKDACEAFKDKDYSLVLFYTASSILFTCISILFIYLIIKHPFQP